MSVNDKVKIANDFLDSQGPAAIQEYTTPSGFEAVGYKPQFIVDAANTAFGAEGWKHVVKAVSVDEVPLKNGGNTLIATAEVAIQLLSENQTVLFETGSQFGGSRVMSGNLPDAKKGAVTDAIGKALSILGIGNRAYRGDLSANFKGKVDKLPTEKDEFTGIPDTSNMSGARFAARPGTGFGPPANGKGNGNGSAAKETIATNVAPAVTLLPIEQPTLLTSPVVTTPTEKTKPRVAFKDSVLGKHF